jgi:hypothetical protein
LPTEITDRFQRARNGGDNNADVIGGAARVRFRAITRPGGREVRRRSKITNDGPAE